MLGFYGLFDRAVPYRLGTLHGTPYGLSLPPAGAVSVGTMLAAVDYLIVPSLSGSAPRPCQAASAREEGVGPFLLVTMKGADNSAVKRPCARADFANG